MTTPRLRNIFFLIFLFISRVSFAQQTAIDYYNKISADSIKETVYTLASDSMEGRETGKPGQKKAALFLESKYYSWGLQPEGDQTTVSTNAPQQGRGYFQNHSINLKNNKLRNLVVNGQSFLYGQDFYYASGFSDTIISFKKIIFIGNDSRIHPWKNLLSPNKYADKNLVLFDVDSSADYLGLAIDLERSKSAAIFVITTNGNIRRRFSEQMQNTARVPLIFISEEVAEKFFKIGVYEKKTNTIRKKSKTYSKNINCSLSVEIVKNTNQLQGQNVIALIPGSEIKNETVVISSHYDHLGKNDSLIFHGADDNGSGTAAVVELARVFMLAKKEGRGPKRNILFLNVSGEEKGLLGSAWFVANPTIPLDNIVADLNIDMVGRTDPMHDSLGVKDYSYIIGADKMSAELNSINEEQNKAGPNLKLDYKYNSPDDPNRFYSRSDHYNFVKKGIPVIFYFDGIHADYHKSTDTPDKIDCKLLAKRAGLVFLTAWQLANRKDRILLDKKNPGDK